jgi:hypothetical protein
MNIDYLVFQKGRGAHDRNRSARFPFSSALKFDCAGKALLLSQAPAAIVEEGETEKTPVRAETFRRIWSLVRHGPELIVGLFAIFYLILALALAASITLLHFRPLIRDTGNDLKADTYLPANRSLLWRRWMTKVLLSPYVAHGPRGTSRNSTNFQSHASLTPRPR